jgi:two-component system LytT family response regulator
MTTPRLRTVLVDDEVLARLALRQALATHDEVEIVGECGNAAEAMQAVRALHPDLLFLDIQMPGMDGFELLHELAPDHLPLVVFATAFAEHALQAFDARALDYVLKPIDQARFDQAMARVQQHWQGLHATTVGATEATPASGHVQRLSVRHGEHIRVLAVDDIDWIRADGNYCTSTSAPCATCTATPCATCWPNSTPPASCASTAAPSSTWPACAKCIRCSRAGRRSCCRMGPGWI